MRPTTWHVARNTPTTTTFTFRLNAAGPLAPVTHAAFRWLRGYVLKRGFLDGPQGWRIAGFCAREVALKYRLLRAMHAGTARH